MVPVWAAAESVLLTLTVTLPSSVIEPGVDLQEAGRIFHRKGDGVVVAGEELAQPTTTFVWLDAVIEGVTTAPLWKRCC